MQSAGPINVKIVLNLPDLPPKWPLTLTRGCGKCSRTSTPTCPRPTSTRRWSPFAQSESIGAFLRRTTAQRKHFLHRYIKSPDLLHKLIDLGLTFRLLPLLSKSNLKVVDIAFSIMGNIMLEDLPKKQVKERERYITREAGRIQTPKMQSPPDSRPCAPRDPADRLPLRELDVLRGVRPLQVRCSVSVVRLRSVT